MNQNPEEKLYAWSNKEASESEEDYYEIKKAPMMMLLPGSIPRESKKLSDATQSSVKTEDDEESEYTYETGKKSNGFLK